MTRSHFNRIVKSVFDDYNELYDMLEYGITSGRVDAFYHETQVYILLKKPYPYIISWYKLTHVGRDLEVSDNIQQHIIYTLECAKDEWRSQK